jgi:hypothetical protein
MKQKHKSLLLGVRSLAATPLFTALLIVAAALLSALLVVAGVLVLTEISVG